MRFNQVLAFIAVIAPFVAGAPVPVSEDAKRGGDIYGTCGDGVSGSPPICTEKKRAVEIYGFVNDPNQYGKKSKKVVDVPQIYGVDAHAPIYTDPATFGKRAPIGPIYSDSDTHTDRREALNIPN